MTSRDAASNLPPLTAVQSEQMARVSRAVQTAIEQHGGWLRFDDYLQLVLYAPGLGYYSAGSTKLGAEGDFITAPELSPLFGRCVARQCAQVLQECGGSVVEFGPGSGALAATLLPELERLQQLPERYCLVEVSADLRQRQQQRLRRELSAALLARVEWWSTLPAAPLDGVLIANEVVDALPFRRFRQQGGALSEIGVAADAAGALVETLRPAPPALCDEVARLRDGAPWPDGYQSEVCELLTPWLASLGSLLRRGAVLLFDYGLARGEYYHLQRDRGTLRCHYRHRAHDDPWLYPGLQDITAWVDFTRVAEAAIDAQLDVAGYCTQAGFLLGTGIEADVAAASDDLECARRASQARQLLMPDAMGEVFKAMALTRALDVPLRGFAYQDLRRSL